MAGEETPAKTISPEIRLQALASALADARYESDMWRVKYAEAQTELEQIKAIIAAAAPVGEVADNGEAGE